MSQPYSTFTAKRKPIPAFSAKKLASLDEHKAFIARILEERTECEAWPMIEAAFFRADLGSADHSYMVKAQTMCTGYSADVHHVLQRSLCGKDDDDNVLAICRWHHRWIDDHIELAHKLGLLRRSYDSPPIPSQVADNGGESGPETATLPKGAVPPLVAVVSAPPNTGTATPDSPTCFCSHCGKEGADRVGLTVQRDEGGAEEWGFCGEPCLVIFVRDRWMVSQ